MDVTSILPDSCGSARCLKHASWLLGAKRAGPTNLAAVRQVQRFDFGHTWQEGMAVDSCGRLWQLSNPQQKVQLCGAAHLHAS